MWSVFGACGRAGRHHATGSPSRHLLASSTEASGLRFDLTDELSRAFEGVVALSGRGCELRRDDRICPRGAQHRPPLLRAPGRRQHPDHGAIAGRPLQRQQPVGKAGARCARRTTHPRGRGRRVTCAGLRSLASVPPRHSHASDGRRAGASAGMRIRLPESAGCCAAEYLRVRPSAATRRGRARSRVGRRRRAIGSRASSGCSARACRPCAG